MLNLPHNKKDPIGMFSNLFHRSNFSASPDMVKAKGKGRVFHYKVFIFMKLLQDQSCAKFKNLTKIVKINTIKEHITQRG